MHKISWQKRPWFLEASLLHNWQGELDYPQKKGIFYGKSWLSFVWYS